MARLSLMFAATLTPLVLAQPPATNSSDRPSGPIATTRPTVTRTPNPTARRRPCTYPYAGDLQKSIDTLRAHLTDASGDDNARMQLGFTEFLRATEEFSQSLYRFGLRDPSRMLDIPLQRNPKPELNSYDDTRGVFERLLTRLRSAEATLAQITDENVAFRLDLEGTIIDLNGDGRESANERLRLIIPGLVATGGECVIRFDRTDVHWLRGYCHLLMATCEVVLAHDWRDFFQHAGHLIFDRIETPYPFLRDVSIEGPGVINFTDVIAGLHVLRFPVVEPLRMKSALGHLKFLIGQSRTMWTFANKELDNDHEWIPNPRQQSVIRMPITQVMTEVWISMLDEVEAILDGRKLAPFWRSGETRGVNVHRVFTEPREVDVWLWAQGTAAMPYLEQGELTSPEVWNRFLLAFNRDLVPYLFWIN